MRCDLNEQKVGELETLRHWVVGRRLMILQTILLVLHKSYELRTYLFLFDFVISFFSAAPSRGLSNSKEHSKSSETDMTAPKFWLSAGSYGWELGRTSNSPQ
jgi:hypothetical protein